MFHPMPAAVRAPVDDVRFGEFPEGLHAVEKAFASERGDLDGKLLDSGRGFEGLVVLGGKKHAHVEHKKCRAPMALGFVGMVDEAGSVTLAFGSPVHAGFNFSRQISVVGREALDGAESGVVGQNARLGGGGRRFEIRQIQSKGKRRFARVEPADFKFGFDGLIARRSRGDGKPKTGGVAHDRDFFGRCPAVRISFCHGRRGPFLWLRALRSKNCGCFLEIHAMNFCVRGSSRIVSGAQILVQAPWSSTGSG